MSNVLIQDARVQINECKLRLYNSGEHLVEKAAGCVLVDLRFSLYIIVLFIRFEGYFARRFTTMYYLEFKWGGCKTINRKPKQR